MVQYFFPVYLMVDYDLPWLCNNSLASTLVIQTGKWVKFYLAWEYKGLNKHSRLSIEAIGSLLFSLVKDEI